MQKLKPPAKLITAGSKMFTLLTFMTVNVQKHYYTHLLSSTTIYHKGHWLTHQIANIQLANTCSVRLKVKVSSASGKLSSFTAMKMVLLDSVDSRKAAAFTASKSPVSTPSSWVAQARLEFYSLLFNQRHWHNFVLIFKCDVKTDKKGTKELDTGWHHDQRSV